MSSHYIFLAMRFVPLPARCACRASQQRKFLKNKNA
jgi:hypothetical protein